MCEALPLSFESPELPWKRAATGPVLALPGAPVSRALVGDGARVLRYVPHLPGSDGDRRHRHVARRDPPFGQRLTDLVDGQRSFSGVKFALWACASSRGRRVDSAG